MNCFSSPEFPGLCEWGCRGLHFAMPCRSGRIRVHRWVAPLTTGRYSACIRAALAEGKVSSALYDPEQGYPRYFSRDWHLTFVDGPGGRCRTSEGALLPREWAAAREGALRGIPPFGQPGPLPHRARSRRGISGKRPGRNYQPRARPGAVQDCLPGANGLWVTAGSGKISSGLQTGGRLSAPVPDLPARSMCQPACGPSSPVPVGTIRPGRGLESETPARSGAESVESGVVLVDTPELALTANADAKIVEAVLESAAHFTDKADRIA